MRCTIHEYGAGIEIKELLHEGADLQAVINGINAANRRICASLNESADALLIADGKLKARGFAGVVQIDNKIELEIVPKFISIVDDSGWKNTLYLLSVMSKHGAILPQDHVMSSMSYLDSLYEVAGRMLADGYKKNRRNIIRKYRKEQFYDFAIDGEIEFDSILEKNQDGTKQTRIRFDIYNPYNAVISKAMGITLPYVKDNSTRNILLSAISSYAAQGIPPKRKNVIPSRNKEWLDTYNLAYDIVMGLANSFDAGKIMAPGFITNTWKLWEWLLTVGMVSGNRQHIVKGQESISWGEKEVSGRHFTVNVFPDISIRNHIHEEITFLIDAKYKNFSNRANGEVDRADLYEAFAFCDAAGADLLLLAYPEEISNEMAGTVKLQSVYHVGGKTIAAITVSFGSINESGGIYRFSHNLQRGVAEIVEILSHDQNVL